MLVLETNRAAGGQVRDAHTADHFYAVEHDGDGITADGEFHPVPLPAPLVGSLGIVGEVGLVVVNLQPDGPAARAGLLLGDILVAVEGAPVRDAGDVQALLGPERVGRPVRASIVRAGALIEVTITVGERPRPGR